MRSKPPVRPFAHNILDMNPDLSDPLTREAAGNEIARLAYALEVVQANHADADSSTLEHQLRQQLLQFLEGKTQADIQQALDALDVVFPAGDVPSTPHSHAHTFPTQSPPSWQSAMDAIEAKWPDLTDADRGVIAQRWRTLMPNATPGNDSLSNAIATLFNVPPPADMAAEMIAESIRNLLINSCLALPAMTACQVQLRTKNKNEAHRTSKLHRDQLAGTSEPDNEILPCLDRAARGDITALEQLRHLSDYFNLYVAAFVRVVEQVVLIDDESRFEELKRLIDPKSIEENCSETDWRGKKSKSTLWEHFVNGLGNDPALQVVASHLRREANVIFEADRLPDFPAGESTDNAPMAN